MTDSILDDRSAHTDEHPPTRRFLGVVVDFGVGLGLIGLGIAGLVLPVLPGWLPLVAGVVVIAGRIPPLRAGLSRLVESRAVQSIVRRVASRRSGRASLARLLRLPHVRRGLETDARWTLIRKMARSAAQGDEEDPE